MFEIYFIIIMICYTVNNFSRLKTNLIFNIIVNKKSKPNKLKLKLLKMYCKKLILKVKINLTYPITSFM